MNVSFPNASTGAGLPPASTGKSTLPDSPKLLAETPRGVSGKPRSFRRFTPCLIKGETFLPVARGVAAGGSPVINRLTNTTSKASDAFFADHFEKNSGLRKLGTLTFSDALGKQKNAELFIAENGGRGLQRGALVLSTPRNFYLTQPITDDNPVITNYGAPLYVGRVPPKNGPEPVTVGQLGANILDKFGEADWLHPISYSPEMSPQQAAACKDK
jgi:hypothetical protein